MGANFVSYDFREKPDQDKYDELVAQACYDYGHAGYSGSLAEAAGALEDAKKHFANPNLAEDWLMENTKKWEAGKVVSYDTPDGQKWMIGAWCSS